MKNSTNLLNATHAEYRKWLYKEAFGEESLDTTSEREDNYEIIDIVLRLGNSHHDTFKAFFTNGPLYDGDVPSKSQRDDLLEAKFVTKVVVKGEWGYNALSYRGAWAFKVVKAIQKFNAEVLNDKSS